MDIPPIMAMTAAFTRLARFPSRTEHSGPENRDRIMDMKGKFCTKAIISPPSSAVW